MSPDSTSSSKPLIWLSLIWRQRDLTRIETGSLELVFIFHTPTDAFTSTFFILSEIRGILKRPWINSSERCLHSFVDAGLKLFLTTRLLKFDFCGDWDFGQDADLLTRCPASIVLMNVCANMPTRRDRAIIRSWKRRLVMV